MGFGITHRIFGQINTINGAVLRNANVNAEVRPTTRRTYSSPVVAFSPLVKRSDTTTSGQRLKCKKRERHLTGTPIILRSMSSGGRRPSVATVFHRNGDALGTHRLTLPGGQKLEQTLVLSWHMRHKTRPRGRSADDNPWMAFPARSSIGSNFSATLVRPTLRKRLETSPLRVLLIEFIGSSIAEPRRRTDSPNSLNSGMEDRPPMQRLHLKQGS